MEISLSNEEVKEIVAEKFCISKEEIFIDEDNFFSLRLESERTIFIKNKL